MSKFKFINILDFIFIFVAIFLIFFAWINFFIRNIFLSIFLAVFLSSTIIFCFRYFKLRKKQKYQLSEKSQIELTKFKFAIQTYSSGKLISVLKKLVPNNCEVKTKNGTLYFLHNNQSWAFIPFLQNLDDIKLLNLIKNVSAENITIFCTSYDKQAEYVGSVFKNRVIKLVDIEKLFSLLQDKNIEINTDNIDLAKPKISIKEILKNSLQPKNAKGYFISGLVLLFTSLIIPYKIYYVVFSSVLLILSILCKFRKRKA